MLIHHFEAETQGLLTKMTKGKAKSPNNSHFMKGTFFLGGSRVKNLGDLRPQVVQCISLMKIFLFLI